MLMEKKETLFEIKKDIVGSHCSNLLAVNGALTELCDCSMFCATLKPLPSFNVHLNVHKMYNYMRARPVHANHRFWFHANMI